MSAADAKKTKQRLIRSWRRPAHRGNFDWPVSGLGGPAFKQRDKARQPGGGLVPVDHAMVDGQRDIVVLSD
jgi:hypothetical protein